MELRGSRWWRSTIPVMEVRKNLAAVGRNLADVRAAAGERGSGGGSTVRAFSCHAPVHSPRLASHND